MLEYYQGVGVSGVMLNGNTVNVLEPGETYRVSEKMAKWCIENGKAVTVETKEITDAKSEKPEVVEISDESREAASDFSQSEPPTTSPVMTSVSTSTRSRHGRK
jgi:hypothetical protein